MINVLQAMIMTDKENPESCDAILQPEPSFQGNLPVANGMSSGITTELRAQAFGAN